MKLELKHLAPYLPYELSVQAKYEFGDLAEFTLIGIVDDVASIIDYKESFNYWISDIKPLLIPMHDLKISDTDMSESDFIFLVKNAKYGSLKYHQAVSLFENHYDVFGLIDAGLAINKNEH